MESPEFLELLNRYRAGAPVIIGAGSRSRQMRTVAGDDPLVLYSMDMPYATPFCIGLARATNFERVVALEGDGNVVAGLCELTTIGRYQPPNLVVAIVDNESYGSFGSGAVTTATHAGVDLAGVARSCGIANAVTVRSLAEAEDALRRAFAEPGPWVIVAKVANRGDTDDRFQFHPPEVVENTFTFRRALRARGIGAGGR